MGWEGKNMWRKKYTYLPFYESSAVELKNNIEKMVKEYGKPTYPEDVLDYKFLCGDLKGWLRVINYFINDPKGDLPFFTAEIADEIAEFMPGTPPFFFNHGVPVS